MQRLAGSSVLEGVLVDWVVTQPTVAPGLPVGLLSAAQKAAELQRIQADRAKLAAREAEVMLGFAADRPDDHDPEPGTPGARSTEWRQTEPEFPGVSESFPDELGMVIGVARGTAAHKLRRAWRWRHDRPATFTALRRGELDERRGQIFADVLAHTRTEMAGRVETIVLPEAAGLSFSALKRRLHEVLLELDADWADERRKLAERNADVWIQPDDGGRATLGAELNAEEAAEGYEFINALAQMAKKDGDGRPIGQIRAEIFSLLVRGAAIDATGARVHLTVFAALEALEGTTTQPADVNGHAITPAHLADLLRRVGALGLTTPVDGSLTFGLTDTDGRLIATLSLAELQKAVRRGEGAFLFVVSDAYTPTRGQREQVNTCDRGCRMPFCGRRTGWADHDHVVAHAHCGQTTCTNLCCLCRTHHRLKTLFRGWLFAMESDGTVHVTTPSGVTRTTKPWAKRRRPTPTPPEPDPPPF